MVKIIASYSNYYLPRDDAITEDSRGVPLKIFQKVFKEDISQRQGGLCFLATLQPFVNIKMEKGS